jgi:transcriptional regulator
MFVPKIHQHENRAEHLQFIKENGFGILVSNVNGKPWATHIPFMMNAEGTKLIAHLARANAQWKDFQQNEEVLVIFPGPHTYISSSWYDHKNVPTWNYIAIHVYGKIRLTEGAEVLDSLKALLDKYEKDSANPVTMESMGEKYVAAQLHGLVGFEIDITRMENAYKLSQNRDDKNYKAITDELEKRNCPFDKEVASEMKKLRPLE